MDVLTHNRQMARNNRWSNDRLYRAVLALQPGEFEAQRVSFFPSISETLNHIYEVDLFYFDMLVEGGEGRRLFDRFFPCEDPAKLAAMQAELDGRLIDFCDELEPDDLDRHVPTDRGEAGIIPERIGDLLSHLFLHQIHHRGQVHAMLAGTSVAPPQLDEFFLDYDLRFRKDEVERLEL
ncbi:putative damage-inducible protein DinB [Pseudaminobacter salicylatoxidans]|uniref:Putative damage-inducible protein DinB n=1 Tax=Pseudaminobacter salicylatoxidans TaxID=93369 RepID=A0A316C8K0_PSESE|nr:DinB family protein [Pseudaminobacter salicylatoxidans]PWJ86000.1 putative damage-inducible protein DinB [Pseudaminobacter salicylatoxidans]